VTRRDTIQVLEQLRERDKANAASILGETRDARAVAELQLARVVHARQRLEAELERGTADERARLDAGQATASDLARAEDFRSLADARLRAERERESEAETRLRAARRAEATAAAALATARADERAVEAHRERLSAEDRKAAQDTEDEVAEEIFSGARGRTAS
jgi:hypothetical protein